MTAPHQIKQVRTKPSGCASLSSSCKHMRVLCRYLWLQGTGMCLFTLAGTPCPCCVDHLPALAGHDALRTCLSKMQRPRACFLHWQSYSETDDDNEKGLAMAK